MKLKVGDIEMDSESGISFDGAQQSDSTDQFPQRSDSTDRLAQRSETTGSELSLDNLPSFPRPVYLAGGLLALGILAALTLGYFLMAAASANAWLMLLPLPGLLLIGGFCVRQYFRQEDPSDRAGQLDHRRAERIRTHLFEREEPASVEQLVDELGWREEAVVRGLKAGVDRKLLAEDLDIDSGHWTYEALASGGMQPSEAKALPIDERAERLPDEPQEQDETQQTLSEHRSKR